MLSLSLCLTCIFITKELKSKTVKKRISMRAPVYTDVKNMY